MIGEPDFPWEKRWNDSTRRWVLINSKQAGDIAITETDAAKMGISFLPVGWSWKLDTSGSPQYISADSDQPMSRAEMMEHRVVQERRTVRVVPVGPTLSQSVRTPPAFGPVAHSADNHRSAARAGFAIEAAHPVEKSTVAVPYAVRQSIFFADTGAPSVLVASAPTKQDGTIASWQSVYQAFSQLCIHRCKWIDASGGGALGLNREDVVDSVGSLSDDQWQFLSQVDADLVTTWMAALMMPRCVTDCCSVQFHAVV